jgi:prolipoprotein diacylglyceryltransferase
LPVLPTQLVSATACFALAFWSWDSLRNGGFSVFTRTIISYSVFRFVIEFVRDDQARNHAGLLSTSQWVAAVIVGIAVLDQVRTAWLPKR